MLASCLLKETRRYLKVSLLVTAAGASGQAAAAEIRLKPVQVAPGVFAVIGDLGPQSYENHGLNSNLGFIVADSGVIVINTGPTVAVARALHAAIKRATSKPLKWTINTGSQPHYWLGNHYFSALGVPIVAHKEAVRIMRQGGAQQLETQRKLLKKQANGTKLSYPTKEIDEEFEIRVGDTHVKVLHFGPAHTAGDVAVWLPQRKIVFAGDIVFTDRLLGVIAVGNSGGWIAAFDRVAALHPQIIVPGHGAPTNITHAGEHTRNYLVYVRTEVKKRLDQGETLQEVVDNIDQTQFRHLRNFDLLAKRNVHQIYLELERDSF